MRSSIDVHTPGRLLWYSFAYVYTLAVLSYSNCIACDVIMQNEHASVPPNLFNNQSKFNWKQLEKKAEIDRIRCVPVNDDYWTISVFVAALMHVNNEIINTRWMTQIGPARAMQHTYVKLVIVLYWLHHCKKKSNFVRKNSGLPSPITSSTLKFLKNLLAM